MGRRRRRGLPASTFASRKQDYLANNGEAMHGGIPGRTYGNQILGKTEPWIFWYPLWGLTHGGYKHPWHAFASTYVSEYARAFSSERIIEDTGYLSDEPDDYSHIATEYHSGGEYYLEYGESGCQYQNAILAFGDQGSKYLHFADYNRDDKAGNSFDVDESAGGWRFLRKDDAGASVAMAVKMGTYAHAIEMCLIGLDYSSYDDFKSAVQRHASIHDNEYGTFTTSKGRKIGREYDQAAQRYYALVDGKRVFPDGTPDNGQLATRLQCVDHRGNKIIDWNNNERRPALLYHRWQHAVATLPAVYRAISIGGGRHRQSERIQVRLHRQQRG